MDTDPKFFHYVLSYIYIYFFSIVKYTVRVYTPNSHARGDYRLTVKVEGQGKQKTTDHVLYETTQDTKRLAAFLMFRVREDM